MIAEYTGKGFIKILHFCIFASANKIKSFVPPFESASFKAALVHFITRAVLTIEKYRINPKSFLLWKGVQHNDGGWGKGLDSLSFQMVLSWITHFLKSLFVTFWSIETAREDIFFVKIPEKRAKHWINEWPKQPRSLTGVKCDKQRYSKVFLADRSFQCKPTSEASFNNYDDYLILRFGRRVI